MLALLTALICGDPAQAAVGQPLGMRAQSSSTIYDGFSIATVGDLLGPRRPIRKFAGAEYEQVVRLLQSADVRFANLESVMFDLDVTPPNGTYGPRADAAVAREWKDIGFDLFSRANNHAFDYEVSGLEATSEVLRQAGIAFAGVGRDQGSARSASFYESPKGRVALVATAATFQDNASAGPATDRVVMRSGVSVVRTREIHLIGEAEMRALRGMEQKVGWPANKPDLMIGENGSTFRVGDRPGVTYEVNDVDRRQVLDAVRDAEEKANFVLFSIHANQTDKGDCGHDTGLEPCESNVPGDFLQPLFHAAIDAGADEVVRHGPHRTMGIEIYKGKPIFYGLGSFFFRVGPGGRLGPGGSMVMPATWYDSFVAISRFEHNRVAEIRIYPIIMREEGDDALRGAPMLAKGTDARRILTRLVEDSKQFGTRIAVRGDVGLISPPPS